MITMEATALKRGMSYVTNTEGEQTGVLFDLTNESVRELVEDLFDTLTVIDRQNEPTVPFSEVRAGIKARLEAEKNSAKI